MTREGFGLGGGGDCIMVLERNWWGKGTNYTHSTVDKIIPHIYRSLGTLPGDGFRYMHYDGTNNIQETIHSWSAPMHKSRTTYKYTILRYHVQ